MKINIVVQCIFALIFCGGCVKNAILPLDIETNNESSFLLCQIDNKKGLYLERYLVREGHDWDEVVFETSIEDAFCLLDQQEVLISWDSVSTWQAWLNNDMLSRTNHLISCNDRIELLSLFRPVTNRPFDVEIISIDTFFNLTALLSLKAEQIMSDESIILIHDDLENPKTQLQILAEGNHYTYSSLIQNDFELTAFLDHDTTISFENSILKVIRLDSEATRFWQSLPIIGFDYPDTDIFDFTDKTQLTYSNINNIFGIYYSQTEYNITNKELTDYLTRR